MGPAAMHRSGAIAIDGLLACLGAPPRMPGGRPMRGIRHRSIVEPRHTIIHSDVRSDTLIVINCLFSSTNVDCRQFFCQRFQSHQIDLRHPGVVNGILESSGICD